jgi:putative transcriptional regulator
LREKLVAKIRLKEVLKEKNVSQGRLSRMADVSVNTIQLLCNDPNHDVMLSTLVKIAKALNVGLDDLVILDDQ